MKNKLLALGTAIIATVTISTATMGTAAAHNSFSLDSCNFNIPYDIDLNNRSVVVSDEDKKLFEIDRNNQLYIEGNKQTLNESQQELVAELGDGYRGMVSSIGKIAGESAEIGLKAATLTLNALFINDPAATQDIVAKLDQIGDKINKHVSETHLSGSLTTDDNFGGELDEELEALIEEATEKASGKVFWDTLWQIFSSDEEEKNDLEFRMEMFGEDIEIQIEEQAQELKIAAEQLCDQITELDKTESRLQNSLSSFADIDVVQSD